MAVHFEDLKLPSMKRAIQIARGEIEAAAVQEVTDAWQVIHDGGYHAELMPWQLGVLQNLVFGQVVQGEPRTVPGLPESYAPYGALKGIEK